MTTDPLLEKRIENLEEKILSLKLTQNQHRLDILALASGLRCIACHGCALHTQNAYISAMASSVAVCESSSE